MSNRSHPPLASLITRIHCFCNSVDSPRGSTALNDSVVVKSTLGRLLVRSLISSILFPAVFLLVCNLPLPATSTQNAPPSQTSAQGVLRPGSEAAVTNTTVDERLVSVLVHKGVLSRNEAKTLAGLPAVAMADWIAQDRQLARHARFLALGGALLSTGLLIADLGRPERFMAMLRVFKRQSPMSVGAWVLAGFGSSLGTALFARWVEKKLEWKPVGVLASTAEIFSVLFGLPFSNYTGVLIGATAIPVWHESINTLPLHFGMSGLSSGVAALELMGHDHSRGLNLLGVLAAAVETWQGYHIETTVRPAVQPLKHGVSGWLTRTGGVLSGPVPLALRLGSLLSGSCGMRRIAAVCGFTGSLVTRYAWMKAGHASIRDSQLALDRSEG